MKDFRDSEEAFGLFEHDADRSHFDLRVRRGDTVASWALPSALPAPGDEHLAFRLEDRGPEVLERGEVTEERYGSGPVETLDSGPCDVETWTEGRVELRLRGDQARWGVTLTRDEGDDWRIAGHR